MGVVAHRRTNMSDDILQILKCIFLQVLYCWKEYIFIVFQTFGINQTTKYFLKVQDLYIECHCQISGTLWVWHLSLIQVCPQTIIISCGIVQHRPESTNWIIKNKMTFSFNDYIFSHSRQIYLNLHTYFKTPLCFNYMSCRISMNVNLTATTL